MTDSRVEAVLFDLDGTLIDTAPDMGGALNDLLIEENLEPLPLEKIRPYVSQGGLVLTRLGFDGKVPESQIEPLRQRFLHHYRATVADNSRLFDGYDAILDDLESRQVPWGIVTNKPEWLTQPLLEQLDLGKRCAVVIGGDTLAQRKPHPLPLQVAAERIGVNCDRCVYVGDDERDIVAGKAANMKTLVAAYGYIENAADIERWGADGVIDKPADLLRHPFLAQT
ncbi:MAG: phosphoglycolate phosphatase [Gammaproteobacteria bacterium]|nr:MAG: phosphoglycolate phosphatase [Gammaproteobacteria bacterium]UCH39542.1 MAG: phosphoglycolate phosphatase [Gammaproteobacteria bacterium]